MDKESKSAGGGMSSSGIIAVVMLTAGVLFIREVPLETTRLPVNEPRIQQGSSVQDVDARLWQDPFGAVARAREEAHKRDPVEARKVDERRNVPQLRNDIGAHMARTGRPVEVLAAMLPGGPYSDNLETRRRVRYAVLAGLNASRLAPIDAEHLAYFFPKGAATSDGDMPGIVPYEWFEPAPGARARPGDQTQPLVLVLWLDSDVFGGRPLARMSALAGVFDPLPLSWRVLGPGGSDGLRDMVEEVRQQGPDQPISNAFAQLPLRFYSASATAPDARIFGSQPALAPAGESLSAFLARHNIGLVRTIGDDDQLATALIGELGLRGLHAGVLPANGDYADYMQLCDWRATGGRQMLSHVAVISEWDTLYGRTLRGEFRASKDEAGYCVHPFSYVRGLDGQLPSGNADAGADKSGAGKRGSDSSKEDNRRRDGTYVELAEGQSQFDYLRRLALRMAERDRELREASPQGKGLAAIGVLGSDVHDKLLVLQALQPEFPNAIFFTTDLDARFLHPREKAWTRNLVVGSNFGLRLSDRLQSTAPPFRDSYQSSAYLSTRLAMDDARRAQMARTGSAAREAPAGYFEPTTQATISAWFGHPRVFEIGRTRAFDFSPPREAAQVLPSGPAPASALMAVSLPLVPATGTPAARSPCEGPLWDQCGGVHPLPSPLYPRVRTATLLFILTLLILPLWLPPILISRGVRKRLNNALLVADSPRRRLLRWIALIALIGLLHVALPLWLASQWEGFAAWLTRDGKPLVGLEGISTWPTEAIRALTLLLCLYLIYAGWTALAQNLDDIILRFRLGRTRMQLIAEQREAERDLPRWQRIANMFSLRFVRPPGMASQTGLSADTVDFWRRYIVQNRISARATRTSTCVVLALGVSIFLWLALHDAWYIPQRGALSLQVHQSLHALMFVAIYFLVFFVVDATAFCVSFVRGLRVHGANWPASTLAKFEHELQIPRAYLDNWIDLEFIAWRTRCVTRLIYFPFIVLSLFLVSRSAAFDDWYMPATGIVLAVLGATVALACAVALRYAAEASRRYAMERLRDEITRVNAEAPQPAAPAADTADDPPGHMRPPDPPKPAQLSLLLSRMDNLGEGAFAPFWQQPLLKAVLLPFATLGGTSLLDYMALVNV